MRHLVFLATSCGVVTCLAFAFAQQPQPPLPLSPAPETTANSSEPHHTLNLKLYEKRGDSKKILADPTIKAADKQPFSFVAGAQIIDVVPVLEYGTSVNGTVEKIGADHLQVALRISNGSPTKLDDPNITAVQSRSIDVRMNVERSDTKSIQIDADTWFDVRID